MFLVTFDFENSDTVLRSGVMQVVFINDQMFFTVMFWSSKTKDKLVMT